jgi:signal transduction histidine kinase
VLRVRDSGYGVPPERLAALNSGVGLANTRARLEHLYRGSHEFTFCNAADGFSVTISLPFRTTAIAVDQGVRGAPQHQRRQGGQVEVA